MAEEILVVEDITHRFGGATAVDRCTWSVKRGSICALIGPNGAGKSTLVNLLSGALPLQTGSIRFEGEDISRWPPHRRARRGLVRTFQIARDFEKLTVLENMLVAPKNQPGESLWTALVRPGVAVAAERKYLARAVELLNFFELYTLRNDYAAELSGGQKRLLELARAVMCEPKLLILDEPMSALSPVLIDRITRHLRNMRDLGVTLMLVEHNLAVVDQLCDWATVMVEGRPMASGPMSELRAHQGVIDAYLGREVNA